MVSRPSAMLLVAGLGSPFVFGQTGNALLDGTKTHNECAAASGAPRTFHARNERRYFPRPQDVPRSYRRLPRQASPKDPVLHNKIGIAYHQLLQMNLARKEYETAVKLKPDYEEAINNIGTIYYAEKKLPPRHLVVFAGLESGAGRFQIRGRLRESGLRLVLAQELSSAHRWRSRRPCISIPMCLSGTETSA